MGGPNQIADTVVYPLKPIRNKNVMDKEFNTIPASEDFLRTMIDKIPTLAWSCWPDGTTEFLNQRWLDYTGLSMEEALGWGWKAVIHAEDLENLMATWLGLLASGEPGQEEARLRRFDGEYRWFLFRAVPVRDGREKSSGGTGRTPISKTSSVRNPFWLQKSVCWK